jgi:hypothetical protein
MMIFRQWWAFAGASATVCVLLFIMLGRIALSANDVEPGSGWQSSWTCGQALKPDRKLVALLRDSGKLHGYSVNGVVMPILVGESMEAMGTVLFVQRKEQWQLYPVAEGHRVEMVYSTPAYDSFMLFSMWGIEGPGKEYTVLRGKQQFGNVDCIAVAFPADLNQPVWANEYLVLEDFNIGKDGSGALIGSVYREHDGNGTKDWYRYTTNDWGETWRQVVKVNDASKALVGVFQPAIEIKPSKVLLNSLLGSVPR